MNLPSRESVCVCVWMCLCVCVRIPVWSIYARPRMLYMLQGGVCVCVRLGVIVSVQNFRVWIRAQFPKDSSIVTHMFACNWCVCLCVYVCILFYNPSPLATMPAITFAYLKNKHNSISNMANIHIRNIPLKAIRTWNVLACGTVFSLGRGWQVCFMEIFLVGWRFVKIR